MDPSEPSPISTPHNNLFQSGLAQPETAASLIRQLLSPDTVSKLDLATLTRQPESFVDQELRDSHSDVIYSVMTRPDDDGDPKEVLVYFLIEHKSEPAPLTAFQLLRYLIRIWERCLRNDQSLQPIIPLVVYHGQTEWRKNRTLSDVVPYPADLAQFSVQFEFPILDLWRTENEKLGGPEDSFLQSLLVLLKYGRSPQLLEHLPDVFRLIAFTEDPHLADDRITMALIYVMSTNPTINTDSVKQAINQSFPAYVYPDSILGKERQAGREEGIEKGMEAGFLVAKIQMQEERNGLPVSSLESFKSWSIPELAARLAELDSPKQE